MTTPTDSIFLAPGQSRVPLRTEDEVLSAISSGLLEENHFVDLKREVKPGKGENKETARDLAQFAIDGGTVIIGIEELEGGLLKPVPQPLKRLAERLEQIASMSVDPPLPVITRLIPTSNDPTVGYLVVHVPASPAAPHMVDGKYIGRGDKTKHYLTHPEVLRYHQQQRARELDAMALLDVEFGRDIFATPTPVHAHGFWLAEPIAGRPNMMLSLTEGPIQTTGSSTLKALH